MVAETLGSAETRAAVVTRVSTKVKWAELELDGRSGGEAYGKRGANGVDETSWTGGSCDPSS